MWNVDLVTFNHMVKSQEQVSNIKEQFAKKKDKNSMLLFI